MVKARVCTLSRTGGPEVLEWHDRDIAAPGSGELLIRHTAVGLNYIDTYYRSGLYPGQLPMGLGMEAAGVVEAVGADTTGFAAGDRIGYVGPMGAYATHRLLAAGAAVKLPDGVADQVAAAAMLKGCTAEFLIERCAKVSAGQSVLVQAAAGGVGLLLVQWLKALGVRVIATAGGPEKTALATRYGADDVIDYSSEEVAPRVRELTGGKGVSVVFDGVGKATFDGSLDSLAKRGLQISYGNASGAVGPIDFGILARKGSLFVTRPTLFDYYVTRQELETGMGRLFEMIASGKVEVRVDQTYPLEDAAQAHRDLEARKTTGSTVLLP